MEKLEDSVAFELLKLVRALVSLEEEPASHNGAASSSSTSSSRHLDIDLNKPPSDYEKEESQSSVSCNIDLNELPSDSGNEEPKRSDSIKFDLNKTPYDSENEEPPNPNSKPCTSSNKRPLVQQNGRIYVNKKEKKQRREALIRSPPPTPEWLLQVMSTMNGAEDARLIYEKTLCKTDVNPAESRLLISFQEIIRNDFLTQEESTTLVLAGMKTTIINQRSEPCGLVLKKWVMKKKNSPDDGLSYYALNRGWNNVVTVNQLKDGDTINLWSFRCQGALFFALIILPPTLEQSSSSSTS